MIVHNDFIKIQSEARPTFDNVTPRVKEIVAESGVKNGNVLVYSPHTTCSVVIQEYSDGQTYYGTELIQQDLVNVLNKIIPTCTNEGQYLHPCQKHIEDAARLRGEHASWSLNTDAHLRSSIIGRSETIVIEDGELDLGEFGFIHFIDFDSTRARQRTVQIMIIGE